MLARALLPGIDFTPLEAKVNSWGRQFLIKSSGAISGRERVLLLANYMSSELGFRGNTDDYYNERNCLLPCVIESRTGIPITLTLLYMMVAARAGMCVEGINLPAISSPATATSISIPSIAAAFSRPPIAKPSSRSSTSRSKRRTSPTRAPARSSSASSRTCSTFTTSSANARATQR